MSSAGAKPARTPITPQMLEEHAKWLKKGSEGDCEKPLKGTFDFSNFDLAGKGCALSNAELDGSNFEGTNLEGVGFRNASLRNVVFGDISSLRAEDFAGADLTGVPKLPFRFRDFGSEEFSRSTRRLFAIMLLACGYAVLIILSTTHLRILTGSGEFPFPLGKISFQEVYFGPYLLFPFILMGLYIYFHIYLNRLRDRLAVMPRVFQNGINLDLRVYPWLPGEVVCMSLAPVEVGRTLHGFILQLVVCLLTYFLVPVLLLVFWWTCLAAHEPGLSYLQVLCLSVALWFGLSSFLQMMIDRHKSWAVRAFLAAFVLAVLSVMVTNSAVNTNRAELSAEEQGRQLFAPTRFLENYLGPRIADLRTAGWELRPQNGKHENNLTLPRTVHLSSKNLRYAQAMGAWLVGADLRKTDLTGSDLRDAHLDGAIFSPSQAPTDDSSRINGKVDGQDVSNSGLNSPGKGTRLAFANLAGACLKGVEGLDKVNYMSGRNWFRAVSDFKIRLPERLQGIPEETNRHESNPKERDEELDFSGSNLRGSDFRKLNLANANFGDTDVALSQWEGADVYQANLSMVKNLDFEQFKRARNWIRAVLPNDLQKQTIAQSKHGEQLNLQGLVFEADDFNPLKGAPRFSLERANLKGTKFGASNLAGANLTCAEVDEHTDFSKTDLPIEKARTLRWAKAPIWPANAKSKESNPNCR